MPMYRVDEREMKELNMGERETGCGLLKAQVVVYESKSLTRVACVANLKHNTLREPNVASETAMKARHCDHLPHPCVLVLVS